VLVAGLPAASVAHAAPSDRAPVVVKVTDGGFNWGDAVIGAAGGSAVTLLVGSAALGARRKPESNYRPTSERSTK
jgi:hypothetical protein